MAANDELRDGGTAGHVLRWPGRVLAAEDLRRSLNGHRELVLSPRAVITPLAAEELRNGGVRVTRSAEARAPSSPGRPWGYAPQQTHPMVQSAVQSLRREGLTLKELPADGSDAVCHWARAVAECVAAGECEGGVFFCGDPGLVCCVANKVAGLRAVAVTTVGQAARATLTLGANLLAVEMPGRTFFEVRQILRTLCTHGQPACPDGVACTLRELDGHAHR
jgi:ribose 5-phosphate isomerase RpiB